MNVHYAKIKPAIALGDFLRCTKRAGLLSTLLVFALCLFSTARLSAQFESAQLNGTIRDSKKAVIVGASVEIKNLETGFTRTTKTNSVGVYVITQIPPGYYTVTASSQGFAPVSTSSMALSAAQNLTQDFVLKPGGTNENVQVSADAGVELHTSDSEVGVTLNSQQVNELPTMGRSYTSLLVLNPGTTPMPSGQTGGRKESPAAWAAGSSGTTTSGFGATNTPFGQAEIYPSIQGATPRSNIYRLDGTGNNEAISGDQIIEPIPDDIQELKVVSHTDNAMFGQGLGGTINVITKSGTNRLHGSAWEFWRNPQFGDAKPGPVLDPTAPTFLPQEHSNQYGFSLGGPVKIPWLYDGHNKTFWYFSWEGFRYLNGASVATDTLPTDAELGGDFSHVLATTGAQIYNPYTGKPFPNNQIPSSMIDQNMVNLIKAVVPKPTGSYDPTGTVNYQYQSRTHVNTDQFDVRGDEYLTKRDQLWGHILWTTQDHGTSGWNNDHQEGDGFKGHNIGAQWIHTFGPSSVLTVAFGQNYGVQSPAGSTYYADVDNIVAPFKSYTCGFLNSIRSSGCLMPNFSFTGYMAGWPGENNQAPTGLSHVWEYKADYMQVFGHHTLYFGGDIATNNQGLVVVQAADEDFEAAETSERCGDDPALGPCYIGGDALASALLSLPDWYYRYDVNHTESQGYVNGFYGQDSWKVRDNLTINLGLRWDLSIIPNIHTPYGDYADILDFDNGTDIIQNRPPDCSASGVKEGDACLPAGLPDHVIVSKNGRLYKSDWTDFQPRFGLAWQFQPTTVLHLSFGRTYDNWAAVEQTAQNTQSWMTNQGTYNYGDNLNPVEGQHTAENPGSAYWDWPPPASPFNIGAGYNSRPQIRNPHNDQWTFGLEQQIFGLNKLSINYVGSVGRQLDYGFYANTAKTPSTVDDGQTGLSRAPYPYMGHFFYDIPIGRLDYNALEVQFSGSNRKLGLSYIASYTWSKGLNIGSDGWYMEGDPSIENPYNPMGDRGPTGYNLPHVFTAGWTWSVPVGKNHFSTGSRIADYALGNWKIDGIVSAESGPDYSIIRPGDIAHTGNTMSWGQPGGAYERANLVPGQNPLKSHPTYAEGFNTAAFEDVPNGTFGTSGRNMMRAPSYTDVDTAVFREFPFWESAKLQLRLDAFNVLNHPTLGTPDHCYACDATFGEILGWNSVPRRLQLSGKIVF